MKNKYRIWVPIEVEAENLEAAKIKAMHSGEISINDAQMEKEDCGIWSYIDEDERPLHRVLLKTPNEEYVKRFFKALDEGDNNEL